MQSGDLLTDSEEATWIVEEVLGHGLWGRTWALRGEDGRLAVAKVPYTADDLSGSADRDVLAEACRATARHLATLDEQPLVPVRATLDTPAGLALVHDRLDASLETRLQGGARLTDVLDLLVRVLHRLANARAGGWVHGNLRPTNILLDASGDPLLADPMVPALEPVRRRLEAAAPRDAVTLGHDEAGPPPRASYLPPEARETDVAPGAGWDTWAVCAILYRACSAASSTDRPGTDTARGATLVALPQEGLGRVTLATVKDAAAGRLRVEDANPRFASRATSRLGALLHRALSAETDPSPPYRFLGHAELRQRLVEVDDLIHPAVESASRLILGPEAEQGVFGTNEDVAFSVNVGTTDGITAHEDIATGVQLRDLDAAESGRGDDRVRVPGARFTVDRYPSGRWRFTFHLPEVPPGRYHAKVAFSIKGGTADARVAEGTFEVRPAPGYVPPPPDEAPPPPIPLRRPRPTGAEAPSAEEPPPARFAPDADPPRSPDPAPVVGEHDRPFPRVPAEAAPPDRPADPPRPIPPSPRATPPPRPRPVPPRPAATATLDPAEPPPLPAAPRSEPGTVPTGVASGVPSAPAVALGAPPPAAAPSPPEAPASIAAAGPVPTVPGTQDAPTRIRPVEVAAIGSGTPPSDPGSGVDLAALPDPVLQDYPLPGPQPADPADPMLGGGGLGVDLPRYDDDEPGGFDPVALWDRVVDALGGEPLTAIMAAVGLGAVLLAVVYWLVTGA